MRKEIYQSFQSLKQFCEKEDFKGWDPYDGLNSKVFNILPFKNWSLARMVWIQAFKWSPINLRTLLLVPKGYNSKGIALFLKGYCNLYFSLNESNGMFGEKQEVLKKITYLADLLLTLQNTNYSGSCWGYNFAWQSKAFFLPKNTPTVVATSFVVEALLAAYEITNNRYYLDTAVSAADFIKNDLNRIEKEDGLFMFSYSPLDNRAVYNATLLGTKTLALIYGYTKNEELKELAFKSAKAVCLLQNEDGSFPHSDQVGEKWRDSFHTGFKLESLFFYQKYCADDRFSIQIKNGFNYWTKNYFDKKTGFSYYYDRNMQRDHVDLHCASQAIATFYKLEKFKQNEAFIYKIVSWPMANMQSKKGFFYFQKNKNTINKTLYMRWPNAWMFYGMSFWLLYNHHNDKN